MSEPLSDEVLLYHWSHVTDAYIHYLIDNKVNPGYHDKSDFTEVQATRERVLELRKKNNHIVR